MTRRMIFWLIFSALLIGMYIGARKCLTLEGIKYYAFTLHVLVSQNYLVSVFAYISFYTVALALSLPVSALMTLLGGFLFGTFAGAVYATIGATLGSILAFLIIRNVFGKYLQQKYARPLAHFNRHLELYGYHYMLAIRLASIFPAFMINMFAGLTHVSLKMFAITTAIGLIPSEFVYAFAGQELSELTSVTDIFSLKILLAFLFLALLVLSPVIARKILPKRYF